MHSKRMPGHRHRESKAWCFRMMAASFCVMVTAWARWATTLKWLKSFLLMRPSQQRPRSSYKSNPNYCHQPNKCHPWAISHNHKLQPFRRHLRSQPWQRSDHCICNPNNLVRHNAFHVHDAVETIRSGRICDDTSVWSADKSHASHARYAICVSNGTIKWTAIWLHAMVSKMHPPTMSPSSS